MAKNQPAYDPGRPITLDQVTQLFGKRPLASAKDAHIELRNFWVSPDSQLNDVLSAEGREEGQDDFVNAVWDPESEEWDLF